MVMYRIILSAIVFLMGAVLLAGGVWLASLGGSWFYIALGLALVSAGALTWAGRAIGLAIYAVALLATLVWGIWEVGFDWWALTPRGGVLSLIGVLLLLPWMVRALHGPEEPRARYGLESGLLGAAVVISAAVGVYSMFATPHDVTGAFADERMSASAELETEVPPGEWAAYGRTQYGRRYSPLDQITPENVDQLEVAWTYETGQVRDDEDPGETTYEVTPLMVNDTVYLCTPFGSVIALDAVSGEERWRFDAQLQQPDAMTTQHLTCRGVALHRGTIPTTPEETAPAEAAEAPEAVVPAPGTDGEAPAEDGAEAEAGAPDELLSPEDRLASSVAEVTRDRAGVFQNVATGLAEPDAPNPTVNRETPEYTGPIPEACANRLFYSSADGRLMALSAETGELCPGFGGADGTVNLWANMPNVTPGSAYSTSPPVVTDSVVIIGGAVNDNAATTSPSGVIRAYDVNTGELVWNFDSKEPEQTEPIANDEVYVENAPNMWTVASYDPDLNLVYLPMGNQSPDQYGANRSEAVERFSSSITALDADTGEVAWVFQAVHHDIWDYDMPAQPSLVDLTVGGETVPSLVVPTKQGDIFVLNRETGEPVLPVDEAPAPQSGVVEGDSVPATQPRSSLNFRPEPLRENDMWGATPIDQLYCRIRYRQMNYEGIFTPPSTKGTIHYPGNFGTFNWGAVAVDPERQVVFAMPVYLAFTVKMVPRDNPTERVVSGEGDPIFNENFGARYATEIGSFLSPIGLPCQQPPWGYVAGADLTTGEIAYKRVNGTVRDLSPIPLPFEMGVPGIGGPIVTKGGVAFLSGTLDYYVRGYDLATGEELWRARLPAGGQATPSTYEGSDGRQYLVVVAGGHGSTGTKAGDSIIAYALPQQ
jgi:quinoprotein glucose dehydrogenase